MTAFYGTDAAQDADYEAAVNLLREQRRLPYDGGLLNGKYKVYLACFDRMDFIHKAGAKICMEQRYSRIGCALVNYYE